MAAMVAGAAEEDGPSDTIAHWVDQLTEKARASREAGLAGCLGLLRRRPVDAKQELEGQMETLLGALKTLLKREKGEDFVKACAVAQALGVVAADTDGQLVFNELKPVLAPQCTVEASRAGHTEHALTCLTQLCFFCNDEDQFLGEVLKLCEAHISDFVADDPRVAALRGWGLLATMLEPPQVAQRRDAIIAMHKPLLSHESLDVQVEAGENLALLLEILGEAAEHGAAPSAEQGIAVEDTSAYVLGGEEGEASAGQAGGDQGQADGESSGPDATGRHHGLRRASSAGEDEAEAAGDPDAWLDDLVESFDGLLHDGGRQGHSKRDIKEQRARARAVVAAVRDGELPADKVSVEKTAIELDTWADHKRLNACRDALRDGLAAHLKANPVLFAVLDLAARGLGDHLDGTHLVNLDTRAFFSRGRTKGRTQSRSRARDKREAAKTNFLAAN